MCRIGVFESLTKRRSTSSLYLQWKQLFNELAKQKVENSSIFLNLKSLFWEFDSFLTENQDYRWKDYGNGTELSGVPNLPVLDSEFGFVA